MAYTSDPNWFSTPRLMIAGDWRDNLNTQDRLDLYGYEVPLPVPPPKRLPEKHVNSNLFNQNVKDSKIAGMQFFGDLLYVLYNNAALIRAFDSAGNAINEWRLPITAVNSVS